MCASGDSWKWTNSSSPVCAFLRSILYDLFLLTVITGEYWEKVADEQKRYPARLTLTDKNAPTEGLWCQVRLP
jgi:hypothetical protein